MSEIKNNKIAPLYYDRVFKIVFSREKRILIRFLNNILGTNYLEDAQVSFERPLLSRDKNGKEFRQDVVIVINEKEYICIELNRRADAYSLNRNLIYIMDLMILGLNKGDSSDIIDNKSVKLLNLNNFSNKGGILLEKAYLVYIAVNEIATNLFSVYDLDIAKCRKMIYNENRKDNIVRIGSALTASTIEELSYFLGEELLSMDEKEAFLNTVMEANNREILKAWNEERNQIWKEEMTLKNSYKRGIDEGIEKGLQEGMEKGLQEGMEKGINEEKLSTIKNMLKEKISYETISKVSGKSIEEIKEIENAMGRE